MRQYDFGVIFSASTLAPLSFATSANPAFARFFGPTGPSGVMKTSPPPRSVSTSSLTAAAPRLLCEPRTAPIFESLKNAHKYAPSRLALTSPLIGMPSRYQYLHIARKKILLCHATPTSRSGDDIFATSPAAASD